MNKKIVILTIVLIFLIITGLIAGYYFWQIRNNPENVVKEYLTQTQNFNGLEGQIATAKLKINFSDGLFKNLWEAQLFTREQNIVFLNHKLEQIDNLKKLNSSPEYKKYLDQQTENISNEKINIHQKISNVSVKTLEKNGKFAKVEVSYDIENKNYDGEQKISQKGVYLLNFVKGWKIVDFTDKDGAWSETMDYKKMKADFILSLETKEKMFDELASMMSSQIKQDMKIEVIDEQLGTLGNIVWQEDFTTGQNWTGKDSQTGVILTDSGNAVTRITGKPNSDGFLYKRIIVPTGAYYMIFDFKNEKASPDCFLTLATDKEILEYQSLYKTTDKMEKSHEIFIGDSAGKETLLLFTVNVVGQQNPSILMDNIKIYANLPSLPK